MSTLREKRLDTAFFFLAECSIYILIILWQGDIVANTLMNSPERVITHLGVVLTGAISMNGQVNMPFCMKNVKRGSRGVVSWTCDPLLQPLTLPSHLGWDIKQEVPCLCTNHTVKSHLTLQKEKWPVMMDDIAPIYKRRKFSQKMCSLGKGLWLLKYE